MRDDIFWYIPPATCHRGKPKGCPRSFFLDYFAYARNDEKYLLSNPLPKIRSRNDAKKKAALTLAEVLITLGVIGVIAAMTLPTLIQANKNKEVEAKLKKFYSAMNQSIMLSESENGDYKYWSGAYTSVGVENFLDKYDRIFCSVQHEKM